MSIKLVCIEKNRIVAPIPKISLTGQTFPETDKRSRQKQTEMYKHRQKLTEADRIGHNHTEYKNNRNGPNNIEID